MEEDYSAIIPIVQENYPETANVMQEHYLGYTNLIGYYDIPINVIQRQ